MMDLFTSVHFLTEKLMVKVFSFSKMGHTQKENSTITCSNMVNMYLRVSCTMVILKTTFSTDKVKK